jgi:Spx/MgsR family transcriptional regulator
MKKGSVKIYEYKNCDTCRKALKYLDEHKIAYDKIPIVDQPPTLVELKEMLGYLKAQGGTFKNLFNTSGVQYRELEISEKIKAGMTEAEALKLLEKNGKLIKRPFVLTGNDGVVGFKEANWSRLFK